MIGTTSARFDHATYDRMPHAIPRNRSFTMLKRKRHRRAKFICGVEGGELDRISNSGCFVQFEILPSTYAVTN